MDDRLDVLRQLARDNINRHLGDVCDSDDDPEVIADNVYVLAFDAIHDAGASAEVARRVAEEISKEFT